MRAVVQGLSTGDGDDLATYAPGDPADIGIWLRKIVGPAGTTGEEWFDVGVCTSAWLDRHVRENGPVLGRHYLIVERWNARRVRDYLTAAVESQEAQTWPELAERIGRIGMWEFEDYKP
jgi:hypothetical protein